MEESKFLEAQNLKKQIEYLENCLEKYNDEKAIISISWKECVQFINYQNYNGANNIGSNNIIDKILELPDDIQKEVIKLIKNKLEKLKEEFKNL